MALPCRKAISSAKSARLRNYGTIHPCRSIRLVFIFRTVDDALKRALPLDDDERLPNAIERPRKYLLDNR
jgi:hypothetical protein